MDIAVLLAVVALVLAIIVPFGIEWLRRPRLTIVAAPWQAVAPVPWHFAPVRVMNKPLPRALGWLLTRDVAQSCTAWIEFFNWAGGDRALDVVPGRWSGLPEPLRTITSDPDTSVTVFDPTMVRGSYDVAVGPGGEEIAVAVLLANGKAFAWTAASYSAAGWEHPALALKQGTYRVVVKVRGSSVACERAFKLEYLSSDFTRFRLGAL